MSKIDLYNSDDRDEMRDFFIREYNAKDWRSCNSNWRLWK